MKDMDVIQRQLDRVLGFFPRVEARINSLFGVNTLILIIAALNLSPATCASGMSRCLDRCSSSTCSCPTTICSVRISPMTRESRRAWSSLRKFRNGRKRTI